MRKTMKKTQKLWNMKGCSKSKSKRNLGDKNKKRGGYKRGGSHKCHKCGPSCACKSKYNCRHNCPSNCHLKEKTRKHRGGYCGIKVAGGQRGGNCGCGLQTGGQRGGCQQCLGGGVAVQSGGGIGYIGNPTVGKPWTPEINGWPGVSGQQGETNFFSLNKYDKPYLQTEQISERDQQTYMKGGSRRRRAGGIVPQDFVNLGRSMVYGVGSAYNSLNGYPAPASPLPYKDQFSSPTATNSLFV
jgi:hypothetical protein